MTQLSDSRQTALLVEEASLLPALPRYAADRAALQSVLRGADAIAQKRVAAAVDGALDAAAAPAPVSYPPVYRAPGSRAALHQVWHRNHNG